MTNVNSKCALAAAIQYEKEHISEAHRPVYHMSCPVGWMNDPNGFSVFQDEIHLFFQYHPYELAWGPMHWGHAKTQDFVHWEYLPCAMAPDQPYDEKGCFSGSAISYEGKHYLLYTGVSEKQTNGKTYSIQEQCLAVGDGLVYDKIAQNPVLGGCNLPADASKENFRDPKLWQDENGFHVVVGSQTEEKDGQILQFSSTDLRSWKYDGVLAKGNGNYGIMWECPDFFSLGETAVCITSPMSMEAEGLEFHAGSKAIAFLGTLTESCPFFTQESVQTLDYGLDFYAPQTLLMPDGRRVLIGWMQSWENQMPVPEANWIGMMTLPRELSVVKGRLMQMPVREIETMYQGKPMVYPQVSIREKTSFTGVSGRSLDLRICIEEGEYHLFTLSVASSERRETTISYRPYENTLTFDRSLSGLVHDCAAIRRMPVENKKGAIELRILIDHYSVEVFVNGGAGVMTSLVMTELSATDITFSADQTVMATVEAHIIAAS